MGSNISIYCLLVFDGVLKSIREAAVKYFLLSTLATLFILGGISLCFLVFKTTNFFFINCILSRNNALFITTFFITVKEWFEFFGDLNNFQLFYFLNSEFLFDLFFKFLPSI